VIQGWLFIALGKVYVDINLKGGGGGDVLVYPYIHYTVILVQPGCVFKVKL